MANEKLAAIWARTSTSNQAETSLPAQVSRAKRLLESKGYTIVPEYIKAVDWASLELASCPQYLELYALILSKKIQAIGLLNRDRLSADSDERQLFSIECRRNNVLIIPCDGPPIEDSDEGKLIEHVYTLGKKQSVLRAQLGSAQGLHDRVTQRRLPVTYRRCYGYLWDKKTKTLLPDENWDNLKMITTWLVDGKSYDWIINELKRRGVLSPSGMSEWNKQALVTIVHSPTYAGRYYQLKSRAVAPKKRNGSSYGHTSKIILPLEQAEYLREVTIVNPPLTWGQRAQILEQIKAHQKLSKRNAKADYLLRGFIYCDQHSGINGKPRIYHGRPHHKGWAYACPVGKCRNAHIQGAWVEDQAKFWVNRLLFGDLTSLFNNKSDLAAPTKKSLNGELKELDRKLKTCQAKQIKLTIKNLNEELMEETFKTVNESLNNEVKWINDRKEQIGIELSHLAETDRAKNTLIEYAGELAGKLDTMSNEGWRQLFSDLHMEIHANTFGDIAEPFNDPVDDIDDDTKRLFMLPPFDKDEIGEEAKTAGELYSEPLDEDTNEARAFEREILKQTGKRIPLQFKFGVLLKPADKQDFELLKPDVANKISRIVSVHSGRVKS